MKKSLIAVSLVVIAVVVGLGILPSNKGNAVLAQVAQAMANVENAHLTGWMPSGITGERRTVEVWIKGRTKYAQIVDGEKVSTDNGDVSAELREVGDHSLVTIRPSGSKPLVYGVSLLNLLQAGPEGLDSWLKNCDARITDWKTTTASNGRQQITVEMTRANGNKTLLNIDSDTHLVIGWSEHDSSGNTCLAIERIDYNTAVDDSVFDMQIPQDAIVEDQTISTSADARVKAHREEIGKKLIAMGARCWIGNMKRGARIWVRLDKGSIVFQSLDKDGIWVCQMPDSNRFRILGKALVFTSDNGENPDGRINEVVENEEVIVPGEVIPPSPRARPAPLTGIAKERFELEQKLIAKGARSLGSGVSGTFGTYHRGLFFEPKDGGKQVYFLYFPNRNVYRVIGRAEMRYRRFPRGFTRIVENGEVKAPCAPDGVIEPSH